MMDQDRGFCDEATTISQILGRPISSAPITAKDWEAVYECLSAYVQQCFHSK